MKSFLIIGMGRFGRHCAHKLYEMGHQVMVIDNRESRIDAVLSYVHVAQIGDSTDEQFMSTIGVSDFDCCVCAIGDDFQSSLETTSLLKELGAQYVVARACRDRHKKFLLRNGADEAVYPERQLANWTAIRVSSEHIFDYIELDKNHAIYELDVPGSWIGKTISQVDVRNRYHINVIGLKVNDAVTMDFGPNTIFTGDMRLLVIGQIKQIQKVFKYD
ncbi:potassium channel family protein [Floccifex sp.]|uniref:potassium channel family protein n=1 Tax=Floccifex sp. TaxID=2815810 RepID=UPI002A74DA05|nr:TrkA family potassium uptake protein [Floccifex sp.]MDD7281561.1 TrkA family potassium uptake protein [Erysipelotrichaceae bacterium]MDY2958461.1 TrkA family potassium uptake protein [Floccifex sp.]